MTSATVNSVTTTFSYRGDGLRNSRTTGANTTTFTWDIAAGLPVVIDDGSRYVYGAGLEALGNRAMDKGAILVGTHGLVSLVSSSCREDKTSDALAWRWPLVYPSSASVPRGAARLKAITGSELALNGDASCHNVPTMKPSCKGPEILDALFANPFG